MSIELLKDWDPNKFNKTFDEYLKTLKEKQTNEDDKQTKELNKVYNSKQIYNYTLVELYNEWYYNILLFINNLLHLRFKNIFAGNTLFYLGITIVFCFILYCIIMYFLSLDKTNNNIDNNIDGNKRSIIISFKQ